MNTVAKIGSLAAACIMVAGISSAVTIDSFFDDFEQYGQGDVRGNDPGAYTSWAGVANGFGFIVDIDAEGIRGTASHDRFGDQVLRFDNPYVDSNLRNTIDQVTRDMAVGGVSLGNDYSRGVFINFDLRSIEFGEGASVYTEINLGNARAGRFVLSNQGPDGDLHAALLGWNGDVLFTSIASAPLQMGDWYNISFGLDFVNNRYTLFEVDGIRLDDPEDTYLAHVGRFGDDNRQILVMQPADRVETGGIYLDNVAFQVAPEIVGGVAEIGAGESFNLASASFLNGATSISLGDGAKLDITRGLALALDIELSGDAAIAVENGAEATISGAITASDGFSKEGTGTLVIGGSLTTTGSSGVEVSSGRLEIADGATVTDNSGQGIAVSSGGELGGSGTIVGNVSIGEGGTLSGATSIIGDLTVSGVHVPGFSPGGYTQDGNYTLASDGELQIEMGGYLEATGSFDSPVAGDFDQLFIKGDGILEGTLVVLPWDDFVPQLNDVFYFFMVDGLLDFGALDLDGSAFAGFQFEFVTSTYEFDAVTYNALGIEVVAIPEPRLVAAVFGFIAVLVSLLRRQRLAGCRVP